jgi:TatA/E family protein of Tat protein translocase
MHLGMWEIVGILLVVLLLFGPSKLPGLGKSLGTAIRDFKKGMAGEDEAPPQQKSAQLPSSTPANDVSAANTANVAPKNS